MNVYEELTWRGLVHQVTSPEVAEILGKPGVRCYVGFDPSASSLHVGNLLQVMTLVRMQRAGHRQHEFRNRCLESRAVVGDALVRATHGTHRRRQRTATGVFEGFAGLQHRLLADHAIATHFLDFIVGVGDDPVPRHQLRGVFACVADRHRVREHEVLLLGFRMGLEVLRTNADREFVSGH